MKECYEQKQIKQHRENEEIPRQMGIPRKKQILGRQVKF
jgi:hypothetical protein